MDRTADVGGSSEPAGTGSTDDRMTDRGLPYRRPQARESGEPTGENWFGAGAPDTTGTSPSLTAGSRDLPVVTATGSPVGATGSPVRSARINFEDLDFAATPPAPESGSATSGSGSATSGFGSAAPEFGPATPAGPGRASFGFSDGPIGGTRPASSSRRRSPEDSGTLPIIRQPPVPDTDPVPSSPAPSFASFSPASGSFPAVSPASRDDLSEAAFASGPEAFFAGAPGPEVLESPRPVPDRPRQSRLVTAGMTVLGLIALAVLGVTGFVYYNGADTDLGGMLGSGGEQPQAAQQTVTGPIEGRTIATFELLAATDRVNLKIADLGEDLYRISTPEGTGMRPSAAIQGDRLAVDLARDGNGAGGQMEVLLAAKVRWTLRFSGYAAERIVDLSEGRMTGIEIVGGTRRAEITLAQAAGTVPVTITGGMEELIVRAPENSPVRVKVNGGAGTVTAGSRTLRDLAPGSTLTPKNWANGDRYDIDAVAPITLLKVENS
ncbi:hypothetical protein [Actinoplanes rectilineatus]|uniref:hypothetical protein n=1 Tax=Actinoplanes rectilineatus TaxID=113571 RepID=UPI0005F2B91E|nr:hypothetical protein [Actinoplanes rectilineatus]